MWAAAAAMLLQAWVQATDADIFRLIFISNYILYIIIESRRNARRRHACRLPPPTTHFS